MRNSISDFAEMAPGQAGHALIGWAEQLQRKTQTCRGLQQEMSQLTVTETSADGAVRVTVDSQDVPTELTPTDRVISSSRRGTRAVVLWTATGIVQEVWFPETVPTTGDSLAIAGGPLDRAG